MKRLVLVALAVFLTVDAVACSPEIIDGYSGFSPQAARFEQKQDVDGRIALLPPPEVRVMKISRAFSGGTPCGDTGFLELEIHWPDASAYSMDEVGFYFRVMSGVQPDQIFPLHPIKARWPKNGKAHFVFLWMDGIANLEALDLEVEVFAVNAGLEIGPSRRFVVKAPGR